VVAVVVEVMVIGVSSFGVRIVAVIPPLFLGVLIDSFDKAPLFLYTQLVTFSKPEGNDFGS
jgi:hypothetical protein